MEQDVIYEIIGYTASLLVAVSLMMSAIVKLRIVNMIGAMTFTLYGILIDSIPVAAMNAFIVLVNLYYLVKIYRDEEYFHLLKTSENSKYLKKFLDFYSENIRKYQPEFSFDTTFHYVVFVLRDMVPAGLILGNIRKDGTLELKLDFVIPRYRDFKVGRFLFVKNINKLKEDGIHKVETPPGNEEHNRYLQKVGFKRKGDLFVKSVQ